MKEKIKKDILAILDRVIEIIKAKETKDIFELKELSNHTIHNASVFQDKDSVQIAVITYAISKIIERGLGEVPKRIAAKVIEARDYLKKDDFEGYSSAIKGLLGEISKVDTRLKPYIDEVIKQGEIKKGSKLYEHGISLAQVAEVTGASQWELMNYVGKTMIVDVPYGKTDAVSRLKFARSLFK